ncbi:hypothetical protein BDW72DRAFT_182759 [Aspergillus terricola var. indicus]
MTSPHLSLFPYRISSRQYHSVLIRKLLNPQSNCTLKPQTQTTMPVLPDPKTSISGSNSDSSTSQDQSNKATAQDHLSKGPQIPDNMPPKASREEIEARMKELNK